MFGDWKQRALEALGRRQEERVAEATYESDLADAQAQRALAMQDIANSFPCSPDRMLAVRNFEHWHHEVRVLGVMGPNGWATCRQGVRPDLLDMAPQAHLIPPAEDTLDEEPHLEITLDEDGVPWVWCEGGGWTEDEARVLEVLRRATAEYGADE